MPGRNRHTTDPGRPIAGDDGYYCVEASNDAWDVNEGETRHFRRLVDAKNYIATKEKNQRFRCIWLSEWGRYVKAGGRSEEAWIYFWWTEATELGLERGPGGRGEGVPYGRSRPVAYRPLAPDAEHF